MTANLAAWHDLGRQLIARRVELDPEYRNRRTFCEATGMEYRVISDIENGRRDNYSKTTLRGIEQAYGLPTGSVDRFLRSGGDLLAVPTHFEERPPPEPAANTLEPEPATDPAIQAGLDAIAAIVAAMDTALQQKIDEQNQELREEIRGLRSDVQRLAEERDQLRDSGTDGQQNIA